MQSPGRVVKTCAGRRGGRGRGRGRDAAGGTSTCDRTSRGRPVSQVGCSGYTACVSAWRNSYCLPFPHLHIPHRLSASLSSTRFILLVNIVTPCRQFGPPVGFEWFSHLAPRRAATSKTWRRGREGDCRLQRCTLRTPSPPLPFYSCRNIHRLLLGPLPLGALPGRRLESWNGACVFYPSRSRN